jgi:hypothetical protein
VTGLDARRAAGGVVLRRTGQLPDAPRACARLSWDSAFNRRSVVNMIIYIVGLVVVIGFVLGFLGLR